MLKRQLTLDNEEEVKEAAEVANHQVKEKANATIPSVTTGLLKRQLTSSGDDKEEAAETAAAPTKLHNKTITILAPSKASNMKRLNSLLYDEKEQQLQGEEDEKIEDEPMPTNFTWKEEEGTTSVSPESESNNSNKNNNNNNLEEDTNKEEEESLENGQTLSRSDTIFQGKKLIKIIFYYIYIYIIYTNYFILHTR